MESVKLHITDLKDWMKTNFILKNKLECTIPLLYKDDGRRGDMEGLCNWKNMPSEDEQTLTVFKWPRQIFVRSTFSSGSTG